MISMKDFRDQLTEKDRSLFEEFQDAESMMKAMRLACAKQKETSRLLVCCNKINNFSESFAPYFDIINVFVQAKPEWLSVFWGSIRLIFQVRARASQIFQSNPILSLAATM
jgi:hypothetical protein